MMQVNMGRVRKTRVATTTSLRPCRLLTTSADKRLRRIHALSRRLNGPSHPKHLRKLLSLMRHHVQEITELYQHCDKHYLVEIGDLMILCLEVLIENDLSLDAMGAQGFQRYENKLTQLLARMR